MLGSVVCVDIRVNGRMSKSLLLQGRTPVAGGFHFKPPFTTDTIVRVCTYKVGCPPCHRKPQN